MKRFPVVHTLLLHFLACAGLPVPATAQVVEDSGIGEVISNFVVDQDVLGGGVFYYQILVQDTEETVARGRMDAAGIDRIILAPQTTYRMLSFYAETLSFGYATFTTPASGRRFQIPEIRYQFIPGLADSDADQLPDVHEGIAGTSPSNPDTDGDGFLDGAEVISGQNPLDGFIVDVGIVATGPTSSPAVDITAVNNLAFVAMGSGGVAVFNVRNGFEPVRIAQVDTPGSAHAVAVFGNLLVVADGAAGMAVVDISDPPAARIVRQVPFQRPAVCVAARGNYAYVGLDTGAVVMIDLLTGEEVNRQGSILSTIQDLGIRGEVLYALTAGTLYALDLRNDALTILKTVASPGGVGAGGFRLRLFVGDDFLYASNFSGFNIFDVANPADPVLHRAVVTAQRGWKQIVATGTGLAVATVSPNSTRDGPHNVDVYQVGDDNRDSTYQRTFETPGIATSVAVYNALAYVADDAGGLQVLNYASFDTGGVAPRIIVRHSGIDGRVEEGKVLSVIVDAEDDVQVRNVQFFVDGQSISVDGNFPFETGVVTPLITPQKSSFTFHVVATDTGGNATRSEDITLQLVPDATAPFVRRFLPRSGAVIGNLASYLVTFSEPVDPSAFGIQSVRVTAAGPDGSFGTLDDARVYPLSYDYQAATNSLLLPFSGLEPSLYRVVLSAPIRDLAGNPMAAPEQATFRIYGFSDRDADGVPDDLEPVLGYNPDDSDSDNDGILDGDEDRDNDGLSNTGEIVMRNDPLNPDTDGDGVKDGDEDTDFDGLKDGAEARNRTDPFKIDTDGDGIDDASEVADGLDPNDPSSRYPEATVSLTVSFLNGIVSAADRDLSFVVASPVVSMLNGIVSAADASLSYLVASPSISYLNANIAAADAGGPTTVASPVLSYLNGLLSPLVLDQPLFYASGVVSYENQP